NELIKISTTKTFPAVDIEPLLPGVARARKRPELAGDRLAKEPPTSKMTHETGVSTTVVYRITLRNGTRNSRYTRDLSEVPRAPAATGQHGPCSRLSRGYREGVPACVPRIR